METLEHLLQKQKEISAQINTLREQQKKQGVSEVAAIMQKYQLTLSDISSVLGGQQAKKKKRGSVAPKYQDPVSGATWTGRGKPPVWIAGKERSQFLIRSS